MTINKYETGMSYGDHVDAPYINGNRTDLSFTLFLNDSQAYEGGDLVIQNAGHEDRVKSAAGTVILYPSSAVHRVEEITSGTRIACIGWIKSRVRSSEHRTILFELETVLADMRAVNSPRPVYNRLINIRNNLLRSFGD